MGKELFIDPEFEARCPPLTEDEFRQLEKNILEEGLILMPLIIWDNTIIDGHNRYRIDKNIPAFHSAPMKNSSTADMKPSHGYV